MKRYRAQRENVKYAILGATGQLGSEFCRRLDGSATPLRRPQCELALPDSLRSNLMELNPHVVINCAAYNFVDRAERELETALAVNAWGVRDLAQICRELDCILVHFSTDAVFGVDGFRRSPYRETAPPGPLNAYGFSKLLGEYFVRTICPRHFIIRTCGLYGLQGNGGKRTNFVETMLTLAADGQPVRVVSDQFCTPSYVPDVAEAALALIATNEFGLYHVTNSGSCSWYEFAWTIFERAGMSADLTPITSHQYHAAARRPSYSVLAQAAYESLGLPRLRPWQSALSAYLDERSTIRQLEQQAHYS